MRTSAMHDPGPSGTWQQRLRALALSVLVVVSPLAVGVPATPSAAEVVTADGTTDTSFTLAQVPDTQNEVLSDNPLTADRYQWLVANRTALDLEYVAHSGDYVNWGVVDPVQFTRARAAQDVLDRNGVLSGLAIGNHDTAAVTTGGSAAPNDTRTNLRNTAAFNSTFPLAGFRNVGGVFEAGKVDNMYQTFTAGGLDWLVITHEMWPRQAVVDWMKRLVAANADRNVIVNTHANIDATGVRSTAIFYGDMTAQYVWDQFYSQYPNIKMVLSAHYTGAMYVEQAGVHGNKVAQIMTAYHATYQNHVRLLEIDTAANTISSRVYVNLSTHSSYPSGNIVDASSNVTATGMAFVRPATTAAPAAPSSVTATAGDASASVSFSTPSDGGSPITGYTVTSSPGGLKATGTASPLRVSGLTNGTAYTFTVTATNSAGTSPASAPTTSVTPSAATLPTVTSRTPSSGATGVGLAGNVTATFSGDVSGVSGATFTLRSGTTNVPASVSYASRTATLDPTASLTAGTTYTAGLSSGITDSTGKALTPVEWTFTTAPVSTTRTLVVTAEADTMVKQASPASSYGGATTLLSDRQELSTASSAVHSYLRFNVSGLRTGETVTDAQLSLQTVPTTGGTSNGPVIWRTANTGTLAGAESMTWSTGRPARSGTAAVGNAGSVAHGVRSGTPVSGVTANGVVSFELAPEVTDGLGFFSSEHATTGNRPQLVLTVRAP